MKNKKTQTARLSILSNTTLIIIKIIAGLASGSVSIISEAIHSGMDLLAALIAFFAVRSSDNPPDREHPYGHGKYENVSGVIEAILIYIAALWIIYEAIEKLLSKDKSMTQLFSAFIVMMVSSLINYLVARRLYKVAKETDSIALEADALHLKADVYTSLGVGFGIFLIITTGFTILDPIVAILVAIFILKEATHLLKTAYRPLIDSTLSRDEVHELESVFKQSGYKIHDLRTRKAGNYRFAELHLELPGDMQLSEVHSICDDLEEKAKLKLPHLEITIHVENEHVE